MCFKIKLWSYKLLSSYRKLYHHVWHRKLQLMHFCYTRLKNNYEEMKIILKIYKHMLRRHFTSLIVVLKNFSSLLSSDKCVSLNRKSLFLDVNWGNIFAVLWFNNFWRCFVSKHRSSSRRSSNTCIENLNNNGYRSISWDFQEVVFSHTKKIANTIEQIKLVYNHRLKLKVESVSDVIEFFFAFSID